MTVLLKQLPLSLAAWIYLCLCLSVPPFIFACLPRTVISPPAYFGMKQILYGQQAWSLCVIKDSH